MKKSIQAHLALLGTNLFFAVNLICAKELFLGGFIKPFGLNLIRIVVTAALLWGLFLFKPQKAFIKKSDLPRFLWCAVTGIVINQLLFIKGLSYTYPIHASLLMLITPILITFIASWLLKESLHIYKIIGLILGITGASVLVLARKQDAHAVDVLLGDVLIIINAISYTFYFILVKPLMKSYPPIVIIRTVFTMGVFIALPFCWSETIATPWHLFDSLQWMELGMIVVAGTFLAYLFNAFGIQQLGASVSGTYIYLQPVFTALMTVLFMGDTLQLYKIVAAIFIFSGLYLANKANQYA